MPTWAVPVPDSIADAAGEGREALRALRAEAQDTQRELQKVLQASGNIDPNLARRAANLNQMISGYENRLKEAHRSVVDTVRESAHAFHAAKRVYDGLATGHVGSHTMRDLGTSLRGISGAVEAAGFSGVAGALGTAAAAVTGPAGMVAGAVVGVVVNEIEAADARYRRGLALGDRIGSATRNVVAGFGAQGQLGADWTEAARKAAKEAGQSYLQYKRVGGGYGFGGRGSEGTLVETEESRQRADKAGEAYMKHFEKIMADSQNPLWQAAFAMAGGRAGEVNLEAAGVASSVVAEYRQRQSKQDQYFSANPKEAVKWQEQNRAAKAFEHLQSMRMGTTLECV